MKHLVQERTTRKVARILKPSLKGGKPRIDLYVVKSSSIKEGRGELVVAGYPATYTELANPNNEMVIWFSQSPYRKVIIFRDRYFDVQKFEYDLVPKESPKTAWGDGPKAKKIGSRILNVSEIFLPQETIDWLVLKVGEVL